MSAATRDERHRARVAMVAELLGTALLLATVVGSGIMGERLAGGNAALALLGNTLATGAMLVALITGLAPLSGANFNPLVSGVLWALGQCPGRRALAFMAAQTAGALLGLLAAHAMFDLPLLTPGQQVRSGAAQWFSEAVAAFTLLTVLLQVARHHPERVPVAVGCTIVAGYWFTASTSFANPAVTLARSLTDSFAGIRPVDVPGFVLAQVLGAALALALFRWTTPARA